MITFTDDNFEKEVLGSDKLVVVDFWASWCGPCRMLSPIIEELAEEFEGRAVVGKLSTEDNQIAPQKYGIMSIPCLKFFKNGEEVSELIGLRSKEEIQEKIDNLL
jgi:thioredoxin 1